MQCWNRLLRQVLGSPSLTDFKAWLKKATIKLTKHQWQSCFKQAAGLGEMKRSLQTGISVEGWKCLRKILHLRVLCVLPSFLSFFCAPHTSSSSSQRSYRKDYFLGMPSSSSCSFFWPQQSCTHLPTERMRPFDNRVIQQFVVVWSYFPQFPLGFSLSLFATNRKICYAWNAKFWLPLTAQFNNMYQKPGLSQELFSSTELPKHFFEGF